MLPSHSDPEASHRWMMIGDLLAVSFWLHLSQKENVLGLKVEKEKEVVIFRESVKYLGIEMCYLN